MAEGDLIVLHPQGVAPLRLQPAGLYLRLPRLAERTSRERHSNGISHVEGDPMSAAQMPQAIESLHLDETVWQAWLEKNRKTEQLYFAKRLRFGLLVSPLLAAALLFWLFKIA